MTYHKPFDDKEYQRRLNTVKALMVDRSLDLIICQDPANMTWLTGFDGWSFYVPQAVLVHTDLQLPLWFGRTQDVKSAAMTTGLPDSNIVGFSEHLVHHPDNHPFDELCTLVQHRGWGAAWIGVDFDAHYYTARAHKHIVDGLPAATITDNKELVNWARLVKSDVEIVYMREAGEIVTRTMDKAIERIKPGVMQHEVIADVYHTQTIGLGKKYGDYTSICPLIQVDEATSTPHLTWTNEPLPNNGVVSMEIAAARYHYHAPLTRTISIGKPSKKILDLTKVIVEAGDEAMAIAKPGVTCEEVEALWQKILNKYGYNKESRVGYSIGLNFPPDWGERTASLRPGDKTELQSGMCFHFQSGMWLDNYGAAVSEPIVIGARGGERLSDVARELIVIN